MLGLFFSVCAALADPVPERALLHVEVVGRWATLESDQIWTLDQLPEGGVVLVVPKRDGAQITGVSLQLGADRVQSRVVLPDEALSSYKSALSAGHASGLSITDRPEVLWIGIDAPPIDVPIRVQVGWTALAESTAGEVQLPIPVRSVGRLMSHAAAMAWTRSGAVGFDEPLNGPDGSPLAPTLAIDVVGPADRVQVDAPLDPMRAGPDHTTLRGRVRGERDLLLRWESAPNELQVMAVRQGDQTAIWLEAPDSIPRRRVAPRNLVFAVDPGALSQLDLCRRALLDAIALIDERDTVRVAGLASDNPLSRPRAATASVRRELKLWVRDLAAAHPLPVLLEGETGVLLSGRELPASLAQLGGTSRVYALRVVPGEALHDGGVARVSSVQEGEDVRSAVRRFVNQLSKPVLTDLSVASQGSHRLPDLTLNGPVYRMVPAAVRLSLRGTSVDGPWQRELEPVVLSRGRSLAVHGAMDSADQSAHRGLRAQVPLDGTTLALVRTDEDHAESWAVATDLRLEGLGQAIREAREASIGHLTSESRLPAGRNYQTALTVVGGVQRGNRNIGGGASNENTYMLDGANITDPVTGAFSVNFNFDQVAGQQVLLNGYMPRYQGARGDIVDAQLASGTNTLELKVGWDRTQHWPGPLSAVNAEQLTASVGGPIARDRLWSLGGISAERSDDPDRGLSRLSISEHLAWQPTDKHRLTTFGAWSPTELRTGGHTYNLRGALTQSAWSWFPSSKVETRTTLTATDSRIGRDHRSRQHLQARATASDVRALGEHELELGTDWERITWDPAGLLADTWPGETPERFRAERVGVYAQDRYEVRPWLDLAGGARADWVYGALLLSPRATLGLDPGRNEKTLLHAGFARSWSPLHATDPLHPDGPRSTREDEWLLSLTHRPRRDLDLSLRGAHQRFDGLLNTALTPEPLTLALGTLSLTKHFAKRWSAGATYTRTAALARPEGTLFGVSLLGRFRDRVQAGALWSLPIQRWPLALSGSFALDSHPLLPADPDPTTLQIPAPAQREIKVGLEQTLPARKGDFILRAHYANTAFLEPVAAPEQTLSTDLVPTLPSWEGHRVQAGLSYGF